MLIDLYDEQAGKNFDTPICIIGGGVAGLMLAKRLLSFGWSVLITECGGVDFEKDIQSLAAGPSVGQKYYNLVDSSLRLLGGTTVIWGGRCAELNPEDFTIRPWVPHSGWPINHADLAPYYRETAAIFQVPTPDDGVQPLLSKAPVLRLLHGGDLAVNSWSFDDQADRFIAERVTDITEHPNCRVLLHAAATRLNLSADGSRVHSITVANRARSATITAGHVVVATGGIESPRLLLNSDDVVKTGIGNQHDLAGRFFMEHPHARGGRLEGGKQMDLLRALARTHHLPSGRHTALLRLSAQGQERRQSLNTAMTLGAKPPEHACQALLDRTYSAIKHRLDPYTCNRRLWRATKRAAVAISQSTDPLRPWLMLRAGIRELSMVIRAEQAPNPDSRVLLARETDALGMRRAQLDWQLTGLDKHTVQQLVAALDERLATHGLGHAIPAAWLEDTAITWASDPLVCAHAFGGYHHMGTLRMADDPRHGVVDRHCRVHGIANLHVAGSSVFPTSGWANPTYTIVALALRLGDRLGRYTGK